MTDVPTELKPRLKNVMDSIAAYFEEHDADDSSVESELLNYIANNIRCMACTHEPKEDSIKHFSHAIYRFTCKKCGGQGQVMIGEDKIQW